MKVLNSQQIQQYTDQKMSQVNAKIEDWVKRNPDHKLKMHKAYLSHDSNTIQNTLDKLYHTQMSGGYSTIDDDNAHIGLSNIMDEKANYARYKQNAKRNPKMKAFKYDLKNGFMTPQSVFKSPTKFSKYEAKEAKGEMIAYQQKQHDEDLTKDRYHDEKDPLPVQLDHFDKENTENMINVEPQRPLAYLNRHPHLCQKLHVMTGKQGNAVLKMHSKKAEFLPNHIYHANGKNMGRLVSPTFLDNRIDSMRKKYHHTQDIRDKTLKQDMDKVFGKKTSHTKSVIWKMMHRGLHR